VFLNRRRRQGGEGVAEIKLQRIELHTGVRGLAAVLLVALALVFPAAAAAEAQDCAGPTGDQYCPNTQVLTGSGSGGDPGTGDSSGDLPFTGLDLTLSLAVAAGLLGAGVALRRAVHTRGTAE
jgi:hypothetical protein